MKLPVLSVEGKELRSVDVDDSVFGIEPNMAVLHQAFVAQRNNQRSGTAKTKSRGEVQGSTRKIRMQKYTGRARAGSNRAPTRVGGGVAFGPRPRSYAQDLPKKMRRLAIRSALSGKVADGQLVVVDRLALDRPQTQEVSRILRNVGFERSALLVTATSDRMVLASVRNLHKTKVLPANYLNVADMLNHAGLLITEDALRVAEGLWGQQANGKAPSPKRPTRAAEPVAQADVAKPRAKKADSEAVEEKPAPEASGKAAESKTPVVDRPKRAPRAKAAAAAGVPAKPTAAKKAPPKAKAKAKSDTPAEDKPKRASRAKKTEDGA